MGELTQGIQADPTDPTKFFSQQDNTFQASCRSSARTPEQSWMSDYRHKLQDGVTFATILAVFWLLVTAWYKLETSGL